MPKIDVKSVPERRGSAYPAQFAGIAKDRVRQRLKELSEWMGTYREFWEASFERLDDYLDNLQHDDQPQPEKDAQ